MRVFVTGATGFIGRGIVQELIAAGHQVTGLAPTNSAASELTRPRVEAHRGSPSNTESVAAGARSCDGVIHMGVVQNSPDIAGVFETDKTVIEAIDGALTGSARPFVAAGSTLVLSSNSFGTENDAADPDSFAGARAAAEEAALSFA